MLTISDCSVILNEQVTERYRSGHNEAVLKTVCPQGRVGSNPTLSVQTTVFVEKKKSKPYWRSTQAGRRGSPGKGVGR